MYEWAYFVLAIMSVSTFLMIMKTANRIQPQYPTNRTCASGLYIHHTRLNEYIGICGKTDDCKNDTVIKLREEINKKDIEIQELKRIQSALIVKNVSKFLYEK